MQSGKSGDLLQRRDNNHSQSRHKKKNQFQDPSVVQVSPTKHTSFLDPGRPREFDPSPAQKSLDLQFPSSDEADSYRIYADPGIKTAPNFLQRLQIFRKQTSPSTMTSYPGPSSYPPQNGGPPGHENGPVAAAVADSYFTESRKGEVNELRVLLRNFSAERDPQRKRDIIKKVIAYMTLGIDVSRLFTEMMLAIETRDLVIKKMVYLFLCNYAKTHPELAQMCTNTLQKDCGNDDPMVRGLALRALCSLRLPLMVEYISEPLSRSLRDGHAYVRKTGVMGTLKLFDLDQEAFERCNFVDILYDMLRDPDASVVSNCILVLNEVMAKTPNGGMAINRAIMLHLLNRLHEFSEFDILQVLDLIPRYIPASDDEAFQIMNLLDPVLRTSNAAAVMAVIRAFLSLAEGAAEDPENMRRQVITRVKAPLITLVASGSSELVFCLLQNVEALVDLCPTIFDDEYRQFYCKYHEPTHIKYLKIKILPKLANPDNSPDIVAELAESVNDVDVTLSRLAVRSMTRIACRNVGGPGCEQSIARRLVEMLDLDIDHICSEAATALAQMVRKHPVLKTVIAPPLPRSLKYVHEPTGKASIIYLLGECGDIVREAPYSLEKLIDTYDDITDPTIKIALLTSTMKVFFLRPPEVQKMLGRLLVKATDDVSSQDLHDRALLYYRLLKSSDPKVVESVVKTNSFIGGMTNFAEEDNAELRQALMTEFNTLSTLYQKMAVEFVAPEHQVQYARMPPEHPLAPGSDPAYVVPPPAAHVPSSYHVPPAPSSGGFDLLGFGPSSPATTAEPAAPAEAVLNLQPNVTMTGAEYQAKWGAIADADAIVATVVMRSLPRSTGEVESALFAYNILTMASGELPTEFKFFLYAQDSAGDLFLIQSNLTKSSEALLILTIKVSASSSMGDPNARVDQLTRMMQAALG
jgi:AP-4 complex subunit beta-1